MLAMLMLLLAFAGCGPEGADTTQPPADNTGTPATQPAGEQELQGEITFWHSFTQGPRLETIQAAAISSWRTIPA